MAFILPVGINFADGTTTLPVQPTGASGTPTIIGTPLPTAQIQIWSSGSPSDSIQEEPGSPEIERAEQCTCRHELKMPYSTGLAFWSQMGRGTIVTDTAANVWRILSCNIKRIEGTFCIFSYVAESISFDSPPDDFEINEVSLDLNIIKHPRYAWALNPYVTDASTYTLVGDTPVYYTQTKEAIIRLIQTYIESPFFPSANMVHGLIQDSILSQINGGKLDVTIPNPHYVAPVNQTNSGTLQQSVRWSGLTADYQTAWNAIPGLTLSVPINLADTSNPVVIALAAAQELLTKLWRQEDTPYIAGYEITWTQYFFAPVYLNPGGYVEDPRLVVPQYFMSPYNNGIIPRSYQLSPGYGGDTSASLPSGATTIFDLLPYINPQCYAVNGLYGGPLSFSALRKSDSYSYQRTWFAVHHKWLVAPVGKWDSDIYTSGNRPQVSTDYNDLPNY